MTVIVIGCSAGGIEPLKTIVKALPGDFPAAVLIVNHFPANSRSSLPEILGRATSLRAGHPVDGEPLRTGRIFIAPPGHHLVVKKGHVRITRGPIENGFRPAIDPLFRTAARAYREATIGVILSGSLDDGVSGALEIKHNGGKVVVQHPGEAKIPSMPESTINVVDVDHIAGADEIGPLLRQIVTNRPLQKDHLMTEKETLPDPAELQDAVPLEKMPGTPSTFTCPECSGTLWELRENKFTRYRCHVGHAFSPASLAAAKSMPLETEFWSVLRILNENAAFARKMAVRAHEIGMKRAAAAYEQQAHEIERRTALIRRALRTDEVFEPVEQPERAVS